MRLVDLTKRRTEFEKRRLTVAFIGHPVTLKGWEQWEKLVSGHGATYEFVQFGSRPKKIEGFRHIQVTANENGDSNMMECLLHNDVDIALIWSICPETFSFVYHESSAIGAYIVTNKNTGNVARLVGDHGNGIVLDDETELTTLFSDTENLVKNVTTFRKENRKLYTLEPSMLTLVSELL